MKIEAIKILLMVQKSGNPGYPINLQGLRTICRGLFGISEPSTVSTSSTFSAAAVRFWDLVCTDVLPKKFEAVWGLASP